MIQLTKEQCLPIMMAMVQRVVDVQASHKVLVDIPHLVSARQKMLLRGVYDDIDPTGGELRNFEYKYPFIQKDNRLPIYLYGLLKRDYKIHMSKDVLFVFNIALYDALYSEIDNPKDEGHYIKLRSPSKNTIFRCTFAYYQENGLLYSSSPISNKKVQRSYDTVESFEKELESEHRKHIENIRMCAKLNKLIDLSKDNLPSIVGRELSVSTIKKFISFINKHGVVKFVEVIKTLQYGVIWGEGESWSPEDRIKVELLHSYCRGFKKSPTSFTFDGVQLRMHKCKDDDHIIYSIYFNKSTDLKSDDIDSMETLYRVLKIIGCWDKLMEKCESIALMSA